MCQYQVSSVSSLFIPLLSFFRHLLLLLLRPIPPPFFFSSSFLADVVVVFVPHEELVGSHRACWGPARAVVALLTHECMYAVSSTVNDAVFPLQRWRGYRACGEIEGEGGHSRVRAYFENFALGSRTLGLTESATLVFAGVFILGL